jgi:hypothetical protein
MGTQDRKRGSLRATFSRIRRNPVKLVHALLIVACMVTAPVVLGAWISRQSQVDADERLLAELKAYVAKSAHASTTMQLASETTDPKVIGETEAAGDIWAIYHRPTTAAECPAEPTAFHLGCVETVGRLQKAVRHPATARQHREEPLPTPDLTNNIGRASAATPTSLAT